MQEVFAFIQQYWNIMIIAGAFVLFPAIGGFLAFSKLRSSGAENDLWSEHLLHNSLDCALFCISTDGTIVTWNTASMRLLGYRTKEIIGSSIDTLFMPHENSSLTIMSQISVPGRHEITGHTKRKDGTTFWSQIIVSSLPHSKTQISIAIKDISVQKLLEDKVKVLHSQLQALAVRQEKVLEEERRRIARDLHDELGQLLALFKIKLTKFAETAAEPDGELRNQNIEKQFNWIVKSLDAAVLNVRKIATNLRPPILDSLGLIPALEWYIEEMAKSTGLACCFVCNVSNYAGTPDQTTMLFRTAQELLTNIIKHARARDVIVCLSQDANELKLDIQDNGIGIIESDFTKKDSSGLLGLQKRLSSIGGALKIEGRLPRGTKAVATVPLLPEQREVLRA